MSEGASRSVVDQPVKGKLAQVAPGHVALGHDAERIMSRIDASLVS